MANKLLGWPTREEIVAILAALGAVTPFVLFTKTLIQDGAVEPTPVTVAATIVVPAVIATIVLFKVNGSIEWVNEGTDRYQGGTNE